MDVKEFQEVLLTNCHISGERALIVGVSGGTDSLCLISMLAALKLPVIAAYFDHRLRPESAQDAKYVERIAGELGCQFVLGEGNVREAVKLEHLSLEAAARRARYEFLFAQARKFGAEAVVVGHTADDQVETILMHLLRGSGVDGLKGMSYRTILTVYSTEIPLVRPLLGYWREDTAAYCLQFGLQPVEDHTNQDRRYQRNRIRHELIPFLETYNSKAKERLWTLGQVAQSSLPDSQDLLSWVYQRCLIQEQPGLFVLLDSDRVCELPDGSLRDLVRHAVHQINHETSELDFQSLQRALRLIKRRGRMGKADLGGKIQLEKMHGQIQIRAAGEYLSDGDWPRIDIDRPITLNIPGNTPIAQGWSIYAEIRIVNYGQSISANSTEAWLDLDSIKLPLTARRWLPGDRFQPLGMSGTVKLSDYFINRKIPRPARKEWPMILSGHEIVWAAGLRISEKYRLISSSRQAIHLQLVRK